MSMKNTFKENLDAQAESLKTLGRFHEMWDDPAIVERVEKIRAQVDQLCMALGVEATPVNIGAVAQAALLRSL